MARKLKSLILLFLLVSAYPLSVDAFWKEVIGAVAGGTLIIVGGPLALGIMGFTSGGIAAGSVGAGLMSAAATTGYGGAAVAAMQSAGAAGFGASTVFSGAAVGAGVAHTLSHDEN